MGAVFISYRRGDSEGQARALSIELEELLGKDAVFMDVDSIAPGRDYRQVLQERLESCDMMLALIGPGWIDATDAGGNRRLESPSDFVRQEIAAALKRNITVTPVLLQGANMPAPDRLPHDLQDLSYRNGFELSHLRWESDVRELVKRLGLDADGSQTPVAGRPESMAQNNAVSGARQEQKAVSRLETMPRNATGPDLPGSPRRSRKLLYAILGAAATVILLLLIAIWDSDDSSYSRQSERGPAAASSHGSDPDQAEDARAPAATPAAAKDTSEDSPAQPAPAK